MNNQYSSPVAALTNRKTELYIADLPAVVGRNDTKADVYFFHESISREHCMFECINHRVTVRDLGSTVGTAINGKKLEPNTPYFIEDGAKITVGKVKFVFHADYEEIARRERMQANSAPAPFSGAGAYEAAGGYADGGDSAGVNAGRGQKTITVEARMLTEYEYGEDEVVYIECGLKPEDKPLSFTAELKKAEVEDELKKTQFIAKEDPDEEETEAPAESLPEEPEEDVNEAVDAEDRNLHLSWIDDETGEKKDVTVGQFPFSMGRKSDENDYALRRKGVSRKHLHFEEDEGKFFIVDDNSTNGIKLNGTKIKADERTEIKSGDKLVVAGITIAVRID